MVHRAQKRGGVPPSSFAGRAVFLAAAVALAALLSMPATPLRPAAHAQTPTPSAVIATADPRSDPEPSGVTGAPWLAALAVLVLGGVAALATFVYVRLVARR